MKTFDEFLPLLDEIAAYSRAVEKINFDLATVCPPDGRDLAGEDMALLGKHLHALTHSPAYREGLAELYENRDSLSEVDRRTVERLWKAYGRIKNQSEEFAFALDRARTRAYSVWLEAKEASDFSRFLPALREVSDLTRAAAQLCEPRAATPYETMLDEFEETATVPFLDRFFDELCPAVKALLSRTQAAPHTPRTDFLSRPVPIPVQESISRELLRLEGLRESALVFTTTEHPFTTMFTGKDVRVTTHYHETAFFSNIFTTLHEGGHALFMQNEPAAFYARHADNGMTNAMHECVSRFFENSVGRSAAFLRYLYPILREKTGVLDDVSERELYEAVNAVSPGLNRCEADELTYPLHILLRYRLEKGFINGDFPLEELPARWNAGMRELLGVEVPCDREGVLQDVHWCDSYGYFPSYALGGAYGAQILHTVRQELPFDELLSRGELGPIREFFVERVFARASLQTPDEWIRSITGESLNLRYYLDYLTEKMTDLYRL